MSSKFRGNFCQATDASGLNSVRHQLQVCFLSTSSSFMILQHMKKYLGVLRARNLGQQYLRLRVRDYISDSFLGNDTSYLLALRDPPVYLHNLIECTSMPRTSFQ